jgi:2-polyprenyl-3-methyl-5-hydroxy-6-metoxy-1,4-benzoquinol methylase
MALSIADQIGTLPSGHVHDIGCGDGRFANQALSPRYRSVKAVDFSRTGIDRAKKEAAPNASFDVFDLTSENVEDLGSCGGAFLLGILHHVKRRLPPSLNLSHALRPASW